MSETNLPGPPLVEQPSSKSSDWGLIAAALALPVVGGTALCFVRSFWLTVGISILTVIASAALVAIDARRLGNVDSRGKVHDGAGLLFIGMCLLWIIVYPAAFFRRKLFVGPNLAILSIVAAVFFPAAPYLHGLLFPPDLPSCTSPEVSQLLHQMTHAAPAGPKTTTVDGFRELSYDIKAGVRQGECVLHTESGDLPLKFVVEWTNSDRGMYQVRILATELPACDHPDVIRLLSQVIQKTPVGKTAQSIDGHREIRYDAEANVRHGECVVHTQAGDLQVPFLVEWQDKNKGMFQVRIPPPDLPLCDSPEVAQAIEQGIRGSPLGPTTKSIDGHRETSYDAKAYVRHGECIVHTEDKDIPLKFVVEWQNPLEGRFQVRIVGEQ